MAFCKHACDQVTINLPKKAATLYNEGKLDEFLQVVEYQFPMNLMLLQVYFNLTKEETYDQGLRIRNAATPEQALFILIEVSQTITETLRTRVFNVHNMKL